MRKIPTPVLKNIGFIAAVIMLVVASTALQIPESVSAAGGWGGSEFALTVNVSSVEGGKVKVQDFTAIEYPDISSVTKDTMITLEAIPQEGYTFSGWSGSISSEENPVTFQMDCVKTILANFSEPIYTLTVEIDGDGSVTPSAGTYQYGKNTVVEISATPDEGYEFDGWTGEVKDINSASTTVTINSDTTIRAIFSQKNISTGLLVGIVLGVIIVIGAITWTVVRRQGVKI